LANLEHVTNLSTATNFDNEILSDIIYPVNPEHYPAPFVFSPHLRLPQYVLTKTHCVGFCDGCHHSTLTYDVPSFQFGCMKASISRPPCWKERRFYSVNDVRKAVHLIRDPFDNVVARMHLHVQERRKDGTVPSATLDQFNDTREGVAAWCQYVDAIFQTENPNGERESGGYTPISEVTMRQLKLVPCHSEW
jgi:hypothetical protein